MHSIVTEGFEVGLLAKLGILFNSSLFYHCPYDAWCFYNLTIGELKLTETKREILHYVGTGDKRQKMIQLILIYTHSRRSCIVNFNSTSIQLLVVTCCFHSIVSYTRNKKLKL